MFTLPFHETLKVPDISKFLLASQRYQLGHPDIRRPFKLGFVTCKAGICEPQVLGFYMDLLLGGFKPFHPSFFRPKIGSNFIISISQDSFYDTFWKSQPGDGV